jgi:hypothetical protein
MHGQTNGDESGVIQFARVAKSSEANEGDQLDKAGQTLLQLVQNAAGVAEENSRRALSAAQNLSHQLRAAEDRIAELEAEGRCLSGKSRPGRAVAPSRLH